MDITSALARHRSSTASHYPILLVFVREFTHGTFAAGTEHVDTLPFVRASDAEDWVRSINAINAKHIARGDAKPGARYRSGSQTYKVTSYLVLDVATGLPVAGLPGGAS